MRSFFLCYFETTRRCNLACPYCMSRPLDGPRGRELDTGECKSLVLDEIATISSNAAVSFSGGEHLLRPDAYELLAHAASLGIWSFVNTNGLLLAETDAVSRALEATGGKLVFVLPLNSVDDSVNRLGRDDGTATVLKAAETCVRLGAHHFFIVTISRQNLPTLRKTLSYLKLNRVPMLRAPFVPRGAGACFPELMVDREEMRTQIHPFLTANPLSYISFTPFFGSPEAMQEIWDRFGVGIQGLGCHAGRTFAAVGAEGGVVPCVQLLDSACVRGNVRETPLSEIVAHDEVFQALRARESLRGKCGRCRYRDTCGGCRALAFYTSGDILGEDPTCFFEPADPSDRSELEPLQTAQLEEFVDYIKCVEPWNVLFWGPE